MRSILTLLLLAGLAGPVQAQSLADNLEDARIVSRVKIALAEDEGLRAFTFQPAVENGVLTLVGAVQTPAQKDRVEEVLRGLEGVRTVTNNVRVTNTEGADVSDLPPPVEQETTGTAAEEEPEPEPEEVYHTVRSGDTLGAIARRYGVSVRQLQRLNGLGGSRIRVGQRLRVK